MVRGQNTTNARDSTDVEIHKRMLESSAAARTAHSLLVA